MNNNTMKLETLIGLMYENEENQLICMEDINENVLYIGTVADLRRNHPKSLKATILTMYTERYGAYNGQSGLTVVIKNY